jgi:hypothetical protein
LISTFPIIFGPTILQQKLILDLSAGGNYKLISRCINAWRSRQGDSGTRERLNYILSEKGFLFIALMTVSIIWINIVNILIITLPLIQTASQLDPRNLRNPLLMQVALDSVNVWIPNLKSFQQVNCTYEGTVATHGTPPPGPVISSVSPSDLTILRHSPVTPYAPLLGVWSSKMKKKKNDWKLIPLELPHKWGTLRKVLSIGTRIYKTLGSVTSLFRSRWV